uniref:Uncharacterized protein n=1 Tax=Candidatus Kentrum sp. DK TaxID=2126562 RepID=A0A450TQ54_9GAMM|nr:MAG: hypothetical protein BECKDK2373C_GA0170839_10717 [Candidatus Kentron sp. DK]VFJ70195.1 MAG: hypothetical protein BECKDK2373B_GA0170837_12702 [Candidatus Kentron sp. DK]
MPGNRAIGESLGYGKSCTRGITNYGISEEYPEDALHIALAAISGMDFVWSQPGKSGTKKVDEIPVL